MRHLKRESAAVSVGTALVVCGVAAAVGLAGVGTGSSGSTAQAASVPQSVLEVMQRDLRLTAGQAKTRVEQEKNATALIPAVKAAAGTGYGGAWFNPATGKLNVGLTDLTHAPAVRAAGAEPVTVPNSEVSLNKTKAVIDAMAGQSAPKDVAGWYVDVKNSSVVVQVKQGTTAADVTTFVHRGKAMGPVRVDTAKAMPRTFADIAGGDAYLIDGQARCSIGFAVEGGFVSAGHCGTKGSTATTDDGEPIGTFAFSSFPGNDFSFVKTESTANLTPVVDGFGQGDITVTGDTAAPVGATVCRTGSRTGKHCGTIQATNQTVNHPEGAVPGLTQTNACAEAGDSGGPWVSGTQAQGVTSGGTGDCTVGGTTFFQPLDEILFHPQAHPDHGVSTGPVRHAPHSR